MSSVDSFKSIISEEVGEKEIKKHVFMDSKRRANCCSKWTYWYANKIVDSVNSNKGVMTQNMIEDMNTDALRDEKQLHKFQTKLFQSHEAWQKKHPGKVAAHEYYGFIMSAFRHTFGW